MKNRFYIVGILALLFVGSLQSADATADYNASNYTELNTGITNANGTNLGRPYEIGVTGNIAATGSITNVNRTVSFIGDILDKASLRVIDFGNASRRFIISTAAVFNFENLKLINGISGAIYSYGGPTINIKNSIFDSNKASSGYSGGGAITGTLGTMNIEDTIFSSNQTAGSYDGGAIQASNVNININGGTIFDLNKSYLGGAIYSNGGIQNIAQNAGSEVIFKNNNATSSGGAIYVYNNGTVNIGQNADSEVIFKDNTAGYSGGAIYITGSNTKTNIDNTIFDSNKATNSSGAGGAIYNGGIANIAQNADSEVIFKNNTAGTYGGAIYNSGTVNIGQNPNSEITFKDNTAGTYGGAIYNTGSNAKIKIDNAIFDSNKAINSSGFGGAVYNSSGTVNIGQNAGSEVVFKNNSVNTYGGAIYNTGNNARVNVDNTIFDTNKAKNGGAIFNNGYSEHTISIQDGTYVYEESMIYDNSSEYDYSYYNEYEDDYFNEWDSYYNGILTVGQNNHVDFTKNEATNNGGAIYNQSSATVKNTTFDSNKAGNNGGAIYNYSGYEHGGYGYYTYDEINQNDYYEYDDYAEDYYTYLYKEGSFGERYEEIFRTFDGSLNIKQSEFTGNVAQNNGGAIYNENGTMSIDSSVFDANKATNGGAMYNQVMYGVPYEWSNSYYNGYWINGGYYCGNPPYLLPGNLHIGQAGTVEFKNNIASNQGGAIYNGISYYDNYYYWDWYYYGVDNSAYIQNAIFDSNKANEGGALYNYDDGYYFNYTGNYLELYIGQGSTASVEFKNNIAYGAGGAIYNNGGYININNTIFDSNEAEYGGAIFNSNSSNYGTVYIANDYYSPVEFKNNVAYTSGGAIYNSGNAEINSAIFDSNEAEYGGAIYNDSGNTNIYGATFDSNKAISGSGGAIYNNGGYIGISNTIFDSNEATSASGGAMYNNSSVDISDTTFDSNSADYGGAIYNGAYGTLSVGIGYYLSTPAEFRNNIAYTSGGAIYNEGVLYIQNNYYAATPLEFKNNTAGSLGGAIYNAANAVLNLTSYTSNSIVFTNNTANEIPNDIFNEAGATININGTAGIVSINSGIAGSGTINKSGAGQFLLNADSSNFTGIFNSTGGETIVTTGFFGGQSNISGGTLELAAGSSLADDTVIALGSSGTLKISTNDNFTVETNKLKGISNTYGTVNKTGSGTLNIESSSVFNGNLIQSAGKTIVSALGKMFGGTNTINNSTLEVTSNALDYKVSLGNNGIFKHTATTTDTNTINPTNINFTGSNAVMTFNKATSLGTALANYTLASKIDNNNTNTINFIDSAVKLGNTDFTGGTTYNFNNSTIDLTNNAIQTTNFTKLNTTNNSKLAIDISFDEVADDVILSTDRLNVTTGSGNLNLSMLKIVNDEDATVEKSYSATVLSGATFNNTVSAISTTAREYVVTKDADGTGIILTIVQAADDTSLNGMNVHGGDRGFNFSNSTPSSPETYTIASSLNDTAAGNFVVQGYDSDASNSILSGEGTNSFFNVVDVTNLEIMNLTINAASIDGNGSVLRLGNADGVATLSNVLVQGNTSTGDGGAIHVNQGVLNLDSTAGNIIFSGNSAQGTGDDIFNDGTLNINGNTGVTSLDGGISGSGDIVKSGEGSLLLDSGSDSSNFTGNFNQNNGTTQVSSMAKFFNGLNTITGGMLNWFTNQDKSNTSTLNVNSGTINVGDGVSSSVLTLNNASDSIEADATLNVHENSTLNTNNNSSATFNQGDSWRGAVNNSGGRIILDGFIQRFSGNQSYSQDSGSLVVENGSDFTIGTNSIISGGDVSLLSGSNMSFVANSQFNVDNFTVDNSSVNSLNNSIDVFSGNVLNIAGIDNFAIDFDGLHRTSDTFSFTDINGTGIVNVASMNPLNSNFPVRERFNLNIFNASTLSPDIIFTTTSNEIIAPYGRYQLASLGGGIYQMQFIYDFSRNKEVFRGQVATMAMYNNQLVVNNTLFDHVFLDSGEFSAYAGAQNKYAEINPLFAPYQYTRENRGVWYKAYGTFERLSMTQGLNVDNNLYGSLVGADFDVIKLRNGWKLLPTAYVAYNGGHQTYDNVSLFQNGGQGGLMATFMKESFISSLAAYGGGYNNNMSFQGFKDNTGNWFAGVASKSAYNFRPSKNLVLQPNLLVSYNHFGAQNWDSDFGAVSMNAGQLNGINVAPGLNIIYGKRDWSAYLTAQYMFNINDSISGRLGDIILPDIRMNHGYFEYGLGATKMFKERFMSYAQFVVRNGGRTGIGFQIGISMRL